MGNGGVAIAAERDPVAAPQQRQGRELDPVEEEAEPAEVGADARRLGGAQGADAEADVEHGLGGRGGGDGEADPRQHGALGRQPPA